MAFDHDSLRCIADGGVAPNGNQAHIYHYMTTDADTDVEADGYFDGVLNDGLAVGDVILASIDVDGTPELKSYIVTVGGANVTVALLATA